MMINPDGRTEVRPYDNDAPVIELNQLTRRYGRADAVNGLTLRVPAGRCYGFFGRNGAGKTTTIKCLLNLLRPTPCCQRRAIADQATPRS